MARKYMSTNLEKLGVQYGEILIEPRTGKEWRGCHYTSEWIVVTPEWDEKWKDQYDSTHKHTGDGLNLIRPSSSDDVSAWE